MMHERKLISLSHGAGGKEMGELLRELIISKVKMSGFEEGIGLEDMDDSSTIPLGDIHVTVTTDSYTVNPIFFPGGDIGKLAVTGTINDLAVMGARPLAIVDAMVVEEGFPMDDLKRIVSSMIHTAEGEGVALIGGDFKVMPRKSLDKIIITTSGIGIVSREALITDSGLRPGDKIIVTGTIGEHGATILALQSGIDVGGTSLRSDCASIVEAMKIALELGGVHAAKDPTRGGLAMALNEMARKSKVMIVLEEEKIPIRDEVRMYCEMLGIDPLYLACEGRAVIGASSEVADDIVQKLNKAGYKDATVIGEVRKGREGYVLLRTVVGGVRIVEPPTGELVPRIC